MPSGGRSAPAERYAFPLSPVFSAFGLSGLPVASRLRRFQRTVASEADTLGELAARAPSGHALGGRHDVRPRVRAWRSRSRARGRAHAARSRRSRVARRGPRVPSSVAATASRACGPHAPAPSSSPDASAPSRVLPGRRRATARPRASARDVAWTGAPEADAGLRLVDARGRAPASSGLRSSRAAETTVADPARVGGPRGRPSESPVRRCRLRTAATAMPRRRRTITENLAVDLERSDVGLPPLRPRRSARRRRATRRAAS